MWAAALPLTHTSAATARRHLVGVGRREMGIGEGSDAQKQQLSGSDVLMALQRATDNKLKDKADAAARERGRGRERGNQQHSSTATATATANKSVITKQQQQQQEQSKPLCINPQWAHQLEQLETRLHHLSHASDSDSV